MDNLKNFIKNHSQHIALVVGYLLVACLAFGLGKYGQKPNPIPSLAVNPPPNYNANISGTQTQAATPASNQAALNCEGKIKGSKSLIYHVPGGSFYNRTTSPIRCFDTEADAKAAGFRKSSR